MLRHNHVILPSGTYTCSGSTTQSVGISNSPLSVVLDSTFINPSAVSGTSVNLDTIAGSAGAMTMSQANGSIVRGSGVGLSATNSGTGAMSVTTAGSVAGGSTGISYALWATNNSTATSMTLTQTAGLIQAATYGINAYNVGSGDLTINQTAGTINGTVSAGISATNAGTAAFSITTAGVISGGRSGIIATNNNTATDLTVTQAATGSITGSAYAVHAANNGTGATSITTAGTVRGGRTGYGIDAENSSTTTNLTVKQTSGTISGGTYGIIALGYGKGATSITTAGTVTGTDAGSYGIDVVNSGTNLTVTQTAGSISGVGYGIYAGNGGSGVTSITSAGTISGTGTGSYGLLAQNYGGASDLTVTQTAGSISGDAYGINVSNTGTGATSITTAGPVTGTSSTGISAANSGTAKDLTITQTAGTITGGNVGISATNSGTGIVTIDQRAGTITGGTTGIVANGSTVTITAADTGVTGGTDGIDITGISSGANVGTIAGTIVGTNGKGLSAVASGTDLTVGQTAGSISGNTDGIFVSNQGAGATSVTTAGTVAGTGTGSYGIDASNTSTASNLTVAQTAGSISGTAYGIYAANAGTGATSITTAGTIMGASGGYGIYAVNGTTSLGAGTDLTVTQTATGNISGGAYGIFASNRGTGATSVATAGTLSGTTAGINVYNGATAADVAITQSGGSITGGANGIFAQNWSAGNLTVDQTAGSITGGFGVYAGSYGAGATSVTTEGTVKGTNSWGIRAYNSGTASNLTVDQRAGSVTGGTYGIMAQNNGTGATSVTTAGTVTGTNNDGILAQNASTATDLTVTQTAGTITGGTYGIEAPNSGTGVSRISVAGTVTGGTGGGIATTDPAGNIVTIDLNSGANVSATNGVAIIDTNGNATVTMLSGSKLAGKVLLGNGDDAMIVSGTANISGATLLDGGNSTDSTVTDTLGTSTAATNKLTFLDTTQSLSGTILKNWETVTLTDASVTLTDGTLVTGSGTNPDGSLQGLVLNDASTLTSPTSLAVTGDVAIDATSTLWHGQGGTISNDVTNAGTIYWGNLGHTLTVGGNYTGIAGSTLSLETYLADDSSATDKLAVTGNTAGSSALAVRPFTGSPGAQTNVGIDVIQVAGTSAGTFTLANAVQAGAYQYVIKQGGNGGNASDWYLVSSYDGPSPTPTPTPIPTPTPTPTPPSGPKVPIYRPGAADYMSGQAVNAEEGFWELSTFHQRKGDERATDALERQTWLRPFYYGMQGQGATRFGYSDAQIAGVQAGQDIWVSRNRHNTTSRVAVTFDYADVTSNFNDRYRPMFGLNAKTGSLKGYSVSAGATYTRMDASRAYLDLVGKASVLHNKYSVTDTGYANQNGVRGAFSAEVGKPFGIYGGHWKVEPQGQMAYLHTGYDAFSDAVSSISGYGANALRGRFGARVYNEVPPVHISGLRLYGTADVLHDFLKPTALNVGGTKVSEDYAQTWFDIGLGSQYPLPIFRYAYLYGNALYRHAFDDGKTYGYQFDVGLKASF